MSHNSRLLQKICKHTVVMTEDRVLLKPCVDFRFGNNGRCRQLSLHGGMGGGWRVVEIVDRPYTRCNNTSPYGPSGGPSVRNGHHRGRAHRPPSYTRRFFHAASTLLRISNYIIDTRAPRRSTAIRSRGDFVFPSRRSLRAGAFRPADVVVAGAVVRGPNYLYDAVSRDRLNRPGVLSRRRRAARVCAYRGGVLARVRYTHASRLYTRIRYNDIILCTARSYDNTPRPWTCVTELRRARARRIRAC